MYIWSYIKIAIEIAILWYVIYMILIFIKGTRTEQLLKGMVIIGAIFVIAQQLKLDAILWVMTSNAGLPAPAPAAWAGDRS